MKAKAARASGRLATRGWVLVESRLVDDTFVLARDHVHAEAARRARPGMVVYELDEAVDLCDRGASDATIRTIHELKRRFDGRSLPATGQETAEPI